MSTTDEVKSNVVRVTDELRRRILSRDIAPATKLPSIRKAAKRENVHPLTVAEAYRRLAAEGFVEVQPSVGAFVKELANEGEVLLCMGGPLEVSSYATHIAQHIVANEKIGDAPITVVRAAKGDLAFLDAIRSRAEKRKLRGCLLGSLEPESVHAALELLNQYNVPCVTLSWRTGAPISVTHDEPMEIRQGTRYLIDRGCRSLLLLPLIRDSLTWRMLAEIFVATCEALDVKYELPTQAMRQQSNSLAVQELQGARLAEHFLQGGLRHDGWLITDDWVGRGAIATLLRHGIRVPQQLQICTTARAGDSYPDVFGIPVARLENDESRTAAVACEILQRLMAGEQLEQPQMRLPSRLVTPEDAAERAAAMADHL